MQVDDTYILAMYKLANLAVRKYPKHSFAYDREDLVQVAVLAVLPHVAAYNPALGTFEAFIYPRIVGAMKDEIREYMHNRRDNVGFSDHKVRRFSQYEDGFSKAGSFHAADESGFWDNTWAEHVIADYREAAPSHRAEILDELLAYRRKHMFDDRTWTYLMLRLGYALKQCEMAEKLGVCFSRVSQVESKLFKWLKLKPPKTSPLYKTRTTQPIRYDNITV